MNGPSKESIKVERNKHGLVFLYLSFLFRRSIEYPPANHKFSLCFFTVLDEYGIA
jgi:hypothetical protein